MQGPQSGREGSAKQTCKTKFGPTLYYPTSSILGHLENVRRRFLVQGSSNFFSNVQSSRHLQPKKVNPTQNTNNFPSAVQLHFLRFASPSIPRKTAFATYVHDSRNLPLRMSYCFLCSSQSNPHSENESSRSRPLRPTYPQGLALFTICYYRDLKHSACVST